MSMLCTDVATLPNLLTTCCLLSLGPLAHQIQPSNGGWRHRLCTVYGGHLVYVVVLVAVFSEDVQEAIEDIKVHIKIRIRMFIYLSLAMHLLHTAAWTF
jgi:hypothetical protein